MFKLHFFSKSVLSFFAFAMVLPPFANAGFQQDLQQSVDFIAAETKEDPNTLKTNIKQGIGILSRILDNNSYKLPETADGDRELESVNQAIIHFALRKKQALPSAVKEFKGDHQFFPATATVNHYFHPNNELKGIPFTKREIRSAVLAALPYLDAEDTKIVSPSSTPSFFDVHTPDGKKDDNLSKLNHYYAEIVSSNSNENNAFYARAICATGSNELKAYVISCDIGSRPQLKSPIQRERSKRPSIDSSLLDAGKLRRLYAFTYRRYCEVKFAEAKSHGGTLPESCREFLKTESTKVDDFIDKNKRKLQKEYVDTFERTLHQDKTLTDQRMAQYIAFTECPKEMRTIPLDKLQPLGNMILNMLAAKPTESTWNLESVITRRSETKSQSSDEELDDEDDESNREYSYTNNQNQNTESQDSENQGSETESPPTENKYTENKYSEKDRKRPQTQFNDVRYARALAAHLLNRSSHTVKEELDGLRETRSRTEILAALKEDEKKKQNENKEIQNREVEAAQSAKADSWWKQSWTGIKQTGTNVKLTVQNSLNSILEIPSPESIVANLESALHYSTLLERENLQRLNTAAKLLQEVLSEVEQKGNNQQSPNQNENKGDSQQILNPNESIVDNQQLNQDEHKGPIQEPVTPPEQKETNQQAPNRAGNKRNHWPAIVKAREILDDVQQNYLNHVRSEVVKAEKQELEKSYAIAAEKTGIDALAEVGQFFQQTQSTLENKENHWPTIVKARQMLDYVQQTYLSHLNSGLVTARKEEFEKTYATISKGSSVEAIARAHQLLRDALNAVEHKGNHGLLASEAAELLDDVQEYYLDHVLSEQLAAEKIRLEGVYETYRAKLSHRPEYKTPFSPHSDWMETETKMMLTDLSQIRHYAKTLPEFAASSEKISKLMEYMKSGLFPNCSEGLKKDSVLVQASEVLMQIYLDLFNKLSTEHKNEYPDYSRRSLSKRMEMVLSKLFPLTAMQCPSALNGLEVAHERISEVINLTHDLDIKGLSVDAPRTTAWVTDPANSDAAENLNELINRTDLIRDNEKDREDFFTNFLDDISSGRPETTKHSFTHLLDLFAQKCRGPMATFLNGKYIGANPERVPSYIGKSAGFADLIKGESKLYTLVMMRFVEPENSVMYPVLVEQHIRCADPTNPDCQKQRIKYYFLPYATEAQKAEIRQAFARTAPPAL